MPSLPDISLAPLPARAAQAVSLDIIIPVFNEAAVLPALLEALAATFSSAACVDQRLARVRCLFVDDGSSDGSVALLRAARLPAVEITLIRLSRNFGQQAAISAGIAGADADLVGIMDADLQDPPAALLAMVGRWRAGYEVVYGVRRNRQEAPPKVFLYWAFYRIYRWLSPIAVPVDSGDFSLMSRRVVEELRRLPERVRFPRGLRTWIGFPQVALEYDRPERAAGETSYTWRGLYQLATEGIAALSLRPLQLAQILSIIFFLFSLGAAGAVVIGAIDERSAGPPLPLLAVLILLSNSIILFCLYIIGAYLGRAYLEVKQRPGYVVAEVWRGDDEA
ncbi:MAG TPA: glycosyltransferase family 2 protein [Candidatus Dormibacteraeota bacterium]|nr:glycosyltransferase family 2 protein [Candidatus Dormibacteraeota bacterium]